MTARTIARFRKSESAEVRICLQGYKGRRVVDLRVWYVPDGGTDFVPTRKGVTVDVDRLPELVDAIREAARLSKGKG
jgi:elongation factor P hydroxylase